MKKAFYIIPAIIVLLFTYSCVTNQPGASKSLAKKPSCSQAVYCQVESSNVCAVAQSNEDCKKLGGKKVPACQLP